jgi:uncharacterized repeat protein (TIGR01451 family)
VLIRNGVRTFVVLCVVSACAFAQAADDVYTNLRVSLVVGMPDGTESHLTAQGAKPGDVLEYVAEYHNGANHPVHKLAATIPIPAGTEYVPDSAQPATALASVDGSKYAPIPLTRRVRQAGKVVERPIPYKEYRFLRWPIQDLRGGQTLKFSARATLPASAPAVAAVAR